MDVFVVTHMMLARLTRSNPHENRDLYNTLELESEDIMHTQSGILDEC